MDKKINSLEKITSKWSYFNKGKRGLIYIKKENNNLICKKVQNPKSYAIGNLEKEFNFLKLIHSKLSKKNLISIPVPIKLFKDSFSYYYIPGKDLISFVDNTNKRILIKMVKSILKLLYKLDKLGIVKEEMQHPWKHIIFNNSNNNLIYKKGFYLIDFERCKFSKNPKNVTQFLQFISGQKMELILKKFGILLNKNKIIKLSKLYKEELKLYHLKQKNSLSIRFKTIFSYIK